MRDDFVKRRQQFFSNTTSSLSPRARTSSGHRPLSPSDKDNMKTTVKGWTKRNHSSNPPSPDAKQRSSAAAPKNLRGRLMEGPEWFVPAPPSSSTPTTRSPRHWGKRIDPSVSNDKLDDDDNQWNNNTNLDGWNTSVDEPLGSQSRPISLTATSEGTRARPILLDEREMDILARHAHENRDHDNIVIGTNNNNNKINYNNNRRNHHHQEKFDTTNDMFQQQQSFSLTEDSPKSPSKSKKKGFMGFFRGGRSKKADKVNKTSTRDFTVPEAVSKRSTLFDDEHQVWEDSKEGSSSAAWDTDRNNTWEEDIKFKDSSPTRTWEEDIKFKDSSTLAATTTAGATNAATARSNDRTFVQKSTFDHNDHHNAEESSVVSGVTNPSYFHEDVMKTGKSSSKPAVVADPFDVNSPLFSSGDPFQKVSASPKLSNTPVLSDDFSDPFFPGDDDNELTLKNDGTITTTEEKEDEIEHHHVFNDPELDHVKMDDESPKNSSSSLSKPPLDTVIQSWPSTPPKQQQQNNKKHHHDKNDLSTAKRMAKSAIDKVLENSPATTPRTKNNNNNTRPTTVSVATLATTITPPPKDAHFLKGTVSSSAKVTKKSPSAKKFRARQLAKTFSNTTNNEKTTTANEDIVKTAKSAEPRHYNHRPMSTITKKPPPTRVVTKTTKQDNATKKIKDVPEGRQDERSLSSAETSIKRQNTGDLSLSSVGSDIQRLRSILRRSRLHENAAEPARYIEPLESAFAVYDEKMIKDPMQRAGLRLLSAAVVPIQAAARRYLALRIALTRMWALVVIQAAARRWLQAIHYGKMRDSAIKIQSLARGCFARDEMLLHHCCAIEIQRHVRGLLASLVVYEQIYKITLVQACVRKKQAMDRAMDRMVAIIQIQAASRGFLIRKRQCETKKAAIKIQTAWRCFSGRFNYQLDLLDIIIVQSMWRRKAARVVYQRLYNEKREYSATKIQSHWRSYDCTMNYLHFLADVLIAQSAARRWMAIRRCKRIRHEKATIIQTATRAYLARQLLKRLYAVILIQSVWRGFVCYADYMFTISDIVLVQSIARRWIKCKQYPKLLHEYKSNAAILIQKSWRRFYQMIRFEVLLERSKAATAIQSTWRGFVNYSRYIIMIDAAIRIQALHRGQFVRSVLTEYRGAATIMQCAIRVFLAKKKRAFFSAVRTLYSDSFVIAKQERKCAVDIQRVVRGVKVRDAVNLYVKARLIQSAWRGYVARDDYSYQLQAKTIQTCWRRFACQSVYIFYINARKIQAVWRGHEVRSMVFFYKNARSIQKIWRGYRAWLPYKQFCDSVTT